MATKRDLKKFVRNTCGALAGEILLASAAFDQIDIEKVRDIVRRIAALQEDIISKVSIAFDKAPRDFDNRADYNKARAGYYSNAYTNLLNDFDEQVAEIVVAMNAALPEAVREELKTAVKQK